MCANACRLYYGRAGTGVAQWQVVEMLADMILNEIMVKGCQELASVCDRAAEDTFEDL